MGVKKAYYYLFYRFYKFWEWISIPKFMSDWKAAVSIDVLEVFLGLSGLVYYTVATRERIQTGKGKYIVILYVMLIALPNYFIFQHKDQWKRIVNEFDKRPKRNHKIWGTVTWIIIALIIANLILAFCLMGRIEWKPQ